MDSYNIWYHFYESQTTDQLIKMTLGWIIIQNVAEIWIVSCVMKIIFSQDNKNKREIVNKLNK